MPSFTNFKDFAGAIRRVARSLPRQREAALHTIGTKVVSLAKAKIAHYQPDVVSPQGAWFPAWEPLSFATLYGGVSPEGFHYPGKIELGYAPPDNPLLRTGELRNSISFSMGGTYFGESVTVGSSDIIAAYQELGTSRGIPPRPFIGASMAENMHVNLKIIVHAIELAFTGAR